MVQENTITVIGIGYVGLTTAALFSNAGFKVYALDFDNKRLDSIRKGRSFFYENGLDPLISKAIMGGTLLPTNSYEECIPKSRYVFSCVGTPDNPDGSSNLDYVYASAKSALKLMKPETIYVQKSTVPVGTGEEIEKLFAGSDKVIHYISNPEFLREGTAVFDSLNFDRIVVGGKEKTAREKVINLYRDMVSKRTVISKIAKIALSDKKGFYLATDLKSAELIKVTANAFLALKISFANSIAKLADHAGADVKEILDAVGADERIGRSFLNAGRGYGGGCFPKDVSGLISSASEHGVDLAILTAAQEVNETMPGYIANKLKNSLGDLSGKRIAVLGLAFKAGTSDSRQSPGIKLANILDHAGSKVTAYDPEAHDEAKTDLRTSVTLSESLEQAVDKCDAVCIATDWPEFINFDLKKLTKTMSGTVLVDCMNVLNISAVEDVGLQYVGVGRGK